MRRVLVHDGPADTAAALAAYAACMADNPAAGGRLVRAQSAWRGRRARKALEGEGLMQALADAKKGRTADGQRSREEEE